MEPDSGDMDIRRNLALLLFAVREGDTRLAELIASALRRERGEVVPAGAPLAATRRDVGEPSPVARRTLDALVVMLGLDEPPRR